MPTQPMTFEIPEGFELTAQRFVAFLHEMSDAVAHTPDREVLDRCEGLVLTHGRDLQQEALRQALQQRIEAAEKKGRHCGVAPVVEPKPIAVKPPARS